MNTPERHTVYARDGLRRIWDRLSAPELAMMIAAGGESVIPRITHRAERIAEAWKCENGSSEVIQGELARISAKLNLKASPSREGT